MKTNEIINAKKLTIDEIKSLPLASVVWFSFEHESDEGIAWHGYWPVMVCVPGENGRLIGGDEDSYINISINDHMLDSQEDSFWNFKPNEEQLKGITEEEFNAMPDAEQINNHKLAFAITSKKITVEAFCKLIRMNYQKFWNALTGKREFVQQEIVAIRTALNLSDDEIIEIFFPEFMAQI